MPGLFEYLSDLELGLEVHILAATVSGGGRQPLVKIVVDTPQGVTIDELARITRLLSKDEGVAREVGSVDFRLEVTSPGIQAGLTQPWQFPRHIGRRLLLRLNPPADSDEDDIRIQGKLLRTSPQGIVLRMEGQEEKEILWTQILQALVQLKW